MAAERYGAVPDAGAGLAGGALLVLGGVLVASLALLLTASPLLAVLPVVAVVVTVLAVRLPVRTLLFGLFALVVVSDIVPQSLAEGQDGFYYGPMHPLYTLFHENLDTSVGIGALHFSFTELLFVLLLLLILVRTLAGVRVDRAGRLPTPNALSPVLALSLIAIIAMEVRGMAAGGDFRQSLWQFRQLFWMPVVAGMLCYALRDVRDLERMMTLLTVAACIKIAFGIWYLRTIAWPAGMRASMMTSHNDSVVFVVALVGFASRWAHTPSRRRFRQLAVVGGWLLLGIVLNNRRIAFVGLFASLFVLYLQLRGPLKRSATRLLVRSIPFVLVYLLAGRNRPYGIFKPASLVMSVTQQQDESSMTRVIENTNLVHTLRQHKLLGSGWGHEYVELVKAPDISRFFPQYRFIAHNSVLWLWSIGGVVGFTLIWMPLTLAVFFSRRAYLVAQTPETRSAAVLTMSMVLVYMIQAWGDMGVTSLSCMFIGALGIAGSARLAVATGAFPARVWLLGAPVAPAPAAAALSASQWP